MDKIKECFLNAKISEEKDIIDEERFIRYFHYETVIKDFFEVKKTVKENWLSIIKDKEKLKEYKDYLIRMIDGLNNYFIPQLIRISERYSDDYFG